MADRALCEMIKKQTYPNFINLETAIRTYDRNAVVCGAKAWRYVYHAIHSADKWFFNPYKFEEPEFHISGMDNPDNACEIVLSDKELLEYLYKVREKTENYIDLLDDETLMQCPESCKYSRLELVLMQFRHISFHTGMLNGQTVERTGKFPMYVGPDNMDRLDNGLYDM